MKFQKIVLYISIFLCFFWIFGTAIISAQEQVDELVIQSAESLYEIRIQNLENNIDLLESLNNKILNTIYWALGGLITVFLAIIGLNFFQSFSLNKSRLTSLEKNVEDKFLLLEKQNKVFLDDLKIKINKIAKEESEKAFKDLKDKLKDIKRDALIRQAFEHKAKNEKGYILNLIDVLALDIEKNWDFRIHESIEYILTCLKEGYGKDSSTFTDLQKVLDKLPPEYSLQKNSIEEQMKL